MNEEKKKMINFCKKKHPDLASWSDEQILNYLETIDGQKTALEFYLHNVNTAMQEVFLELNQAMADHMEKHRIEDPQHTDQSEVELIGGRRDGDVMFVFDAVEYIKFPEDGNNWIVYRRNQDNPLRFTHSIEQL